MSWARRYTRFSLFLLTFIATTLAAWQVWPPVGLPLALLIGFDIAAVQFLGAVAVFFHNENQSTMRARAVRDDPDHHVLLLIGSLIIIVVLVALGNELRDHARWTVLLSMATLLLAWVFGNMLFALHYAHAYYTAEVDSAAPGGDAAGLEFPGKLPPDHWDFAYFAFVLGMTFQVSDVVITSRRMRRLALIHGLIGFVFNIGVIGISVGIIGNLFHAD